MKRSLIRVLAVFLSLILTIAAVEPAFVAYAETEGEKTQENSSENAQPLEVTAKAVVLMEGSTGKVIYESHKDEQLMLASVTKIMTLLLIFEALEEGKITLQDEVSVSSHAASMGGSQVYLEENEKQTVDTMLKCISIASANDASVAMAEYIAGSEESFVKLMNERAVQLGMKNSHFLNCCGLDDDITEGHYSSAYDIALMSRELITRFPQISEYSTVWMDTILHKTRKGETEFGLTNTNKLIRTYDGITGLKTGSTSKAKYCLSATASRDGMDMIAVVMAAESPKDRFRDAAKLLDYGFANCSLYKDMGEELTIPKVAVERGVKEEVSGRADGSFQYVLMAGEDGSVIEKQMKMKVKIKAPFKKGARLGEISYSMGGNIIGTLPIVAKEGVEKAHFWDYLKKVGSRYRIPAAEDDKHP